MPTPPAITGLFVFDNDLSFPAEFKQHVQRLIGELVLAVLIVAGRIEVHLVRLDVGLFSASFSSPSPTGWLLFARISMPTDAAPSDRASSQTAAVQPIQVPNLELLQGVNTPGQVKKGSNQHNERTNVAIGNTH
jgi:hypothetical protein